MLIRSSRDDRARSGIASPRKQSGQQAFAAVFELGHMSGVEILRHVLFLLGRHSGGVRLSRDSPRAEQGPRYVILAQTRLPVVELSVTWFQNLASFGWTPEK